MAMEIISAAVLLLIIGAILRKVVRYKSLYPFLPRRYNFGKRRDTLRAALQLLDARQAKVLVETGTARLGLAKTKGDGASTIVFGLWAKQHGAHLHSVDIDPDAIAQASQAVADQGLKGAVTFAAQDSVAFLSDFSEPVDFLYLDSYDYDRRDSAVQAASQAHHLAEFQAIEGRLHDASVVLIDDCAQPGGGKGKLVIDHMLNSGWRIVLDRYQVLLARSEQTAH